MAKKFVNLEEAAKLLRVSPETLNEMRSRGEVFAYRDGANWKFKQEEVDRIIQERASAASEDKANPEFAESEEAPDSILASEVELGQSNPGTSSTIIGRSNVPSEESDIKIAQQTTLSAGSDVKLPVTDAEMLKAASPKPDSSVKADSGLNIKFDDLDTLDLELENPADSGITSGSGILSGSGALSGPATSSILEEPAGSELTVSEEELSLGEEILPEEIMPEAGSREGGSSIDITGAETDDELVLAGSSSGDIGRSGDSDISRSGDSGISLVDPADSGLSLEQPLELGGSVVESLELGGEEEAVQTEEPQQEQQPAEQAATGTDEDFLLTPAEETTSEEGESDSQVIALDHETDFDEAATTMLGSAPPGLAMELAAQEGAVAFEPAGIGGPATGSPGAIGAGMPGAAAAAVPEQYTVWNIALLTLCVCILLLGGMMMYDLMRNMWSWNGPYPVNSNLMDAILSWFE